MPSTTTDHDDDIAARALVQRLHGEIEAALGAYLDEALPRLAARHPALEPLADELCAYVVGGKRLRPMFVLLGHRLAGGRDHHDVMGAALSLELLHTCALLHDDVIDGASHRRGRPATHEGFAARHRAEGLDGSAEDYGRATAILLGDLAFTLADDLWLRCTVSPEQLLAGFAVFTRLREEVMAGQFLDVQAAATRTSDRDLVLAVATLKSGRYSVTRPLELGVVLAGGDEAMVAAVHRVGDPLGRAFQVRDDILGVFGHSEQTGKSASSDLVEGKRTLLVVEALARLDEGGAARLESLLGHGSLDAAAAQQARDLLEQSGGLAAAQAFVEASTAEALDALDDLPAGPATDALRHLADVLAGRNH